MQERDEEGIITKEKLIEKEKNLNKDELDGLKETYVIYFMSFKISRFDINMFETKTNKMFNINMLGANSELEIAIKHTFFTFTLEDIYSRQYLISNPIYERLISTFSDLDMPVC